MWAFVGAVVLPYLANQAGWVACEVGRQPWVVQGVMRTSEANSRTLPVSQVLGVIVLYALVNLSYMVGLGFEDAADSSVVAADVLALVPWRFGEQAAMRCL